MNVKIKQQAPIEFVDRIKAKMEVENLGITQLARKLGVSHPTMTELITYGNKPSFDTCMALSEWLGISPVSALRAAGLLPASGGEKITKDDWEHMLQQLTPEEQDEIYSIMDMKIKRRHGKTWIYLACRHEPESHIKIRYQPALVIVADAVILALKNYRDHPVNTEEIIKKYEHRIEEQRLIRQRVQAAYESGKVYTEEEAHKKIVAIETEIDRLLRAQDRATQQQNAKAAIKQIANQDLDRLRTWIIGDDPRKVNFFLTNLCEKIIFTPTQKARIIWRD